VKKPKPKAIPAKYVDTATRIEYTLETTNHEVQYDRWPAPKIFKP
jgi:hypothetical protein